MNENLADPVRAISTEMILAVGLLAYHDHLTGDRVMANTVHRPAQQRYVRQIHCTTDD